MDQKVEKTALDWAKLYLELKVLYTGASDMLLQFVCDLNVRRIEPTAKAYLEKREAAIKKHGQEKDGSWMVKQYLDDKDENGKEVESPAFLAFREEMKPLEEHKTSLAVDAIEFSMLKGQNPREYMGVFQRVGAELGVFNFKEVYTITDKFLMQEAQNG